MDDTAVLDENSILAPSSSICSSENHSNTSTLWPDESVMFTNPFAVCEDKNSNNNNNNNAWSTPSNDIDEFFNNGDDEADDVTSTPFSGGPVGSISYASTAGAITSPGSSSQGCWMPSVSISEADEGEGGGEGGAEGPSPVISPHRSASPLSIRRETLRDFIRDSIRRKNARFDIPVERTLSNIDELISHATDEREMKELKQQKRLLRNRQAA